MRKVIVVFLFLALVFMSLSWLAIGPDLYRDLKKPTPNVTPQVYMTNDGMVVCVAANCVPENSWEWPVCKEGFLTKADLPCRKVKSEE